MNELSLVMPDTLWHPSPVSARARLFGVPSANVEQASILELDCADGGNILSIAASLPGATCVGISASTEALARGRNLVGKAGLTNIALGEKAEEIEGSFDYIFLRNTFSRVAPEKRSELISFYKNRLTEHGILAVEQLCYPGWHYAESIRQQVRYHTRNIEDPHEKMIAGRQFLHALAQSVPGGMQQYQYVAQTAWESSNRVPDCNFGIEYFDDKRHPSFFYEFGQAFEGSGLQYLCELSLGSMMINQFPPAMGSVIPKDAGVIEGEQYLDFVTNRTRRVSLLCNDQFEVTRNIQPAVCESLYFSAVGAPDDPGKVFEEDEIILNSPYGGSITITNRAAKAAMLALSTRFPMRLNLSEVLEIVKEALGEYTGEDKDAVLETMTACAVSEIARIDTIPGRACFELTDKPVASSLVRAQAEVRDNPYVASLQHRTISIDLTGAILLEMLDGTNGRDDLSKRITELFADGSLSIEKDGEAVTDPAAISETAEQQADAFLAMFAGNGLLEA